MKSNNNSELNKDDDLIFKPLNIKDPFRPDNSLFLSPLNASGTSMEPQSSTLDINYINDKIANAYRANNNSNTYGNWGDYSKLFEESLNNPQTSNTFPFGNMATPGINTSLLNSGITTPTGGSMTPGFGTMTPSNGPITPGFGTTTPSSSSMAPSTGTTSPGSPSMTPSAGTTPSTSTSMAATTGTTSPTIGSMTPGTSSPTTTNGFSFTGATNANISVPNSLNLPPLPLTPYPSSIPSLDLENLNESEEFIPSSNLEDTSPVNNDEDLYSYNDPEYSIDTTNEMSSNSVNAVDILRNFDFSYDYTIDENRNDISSKDVNKIFEEIEKNHPGILATMKAYRIPYPISKVLIKKIIYITAKYNEK